MAEIVFVASLRMDLHFEHFVLGEHDVNESLKLCTSFCVQSTTAQVKLVATIPSLNLVLYDPLCRE